MFPACLPTAGGSAGRRGPLQVRNIKFILSSTDVRLLARIVDRYDFRGSMCTQRVGVIVVACGMSGRDHYRKGETDMRTIRYFVMAFCLTWALGLQGAWAATAGYSDAGQNGVTGVGVVGANYTGTSGVAISGFAVEPTGTTYGGTFFSNSTSGRGVYGVAFATTGTTYGGDFSSASSEGTGVRGLATATGTSTTYGGYFESRGQAGGGVIGLNTATTGSTYGGAFLSSSTGGTGVFGWSLVATGITYGGFFRNESTEGTGVYGIATKTSGTTHGVIGSSNSSSGRGVHGYVSAGTGTTYGMYGISKSTDGRGVYGYASALSGTTYGVIGSVASTDGRGVHGYASAGTGTTFGVYGRSNSTSGRGVYGYASAASGATYGVLGRAESPSGYAVYANGRLHVTGNFTAAGTKAAVVRLENGDGVRLYAEEASENWFADYGSARLQNGKAVIEIDPTFAQTVNTASEYLVFLTPEGDCKGLFIVRKGKQSFEVRELEGGQSGIDFSYRIVAKRKGYEQERMARVPMEEMVALSGPASETVMGGETEPEKLAAVDAEAISPLE